VEAGSNTSTVTLRVVGGDKKESLKSETVKYGRESQGTRTRERLRWQGPAAYKKVRPDLSSEGAPHKNNTVTVKQEWKYKYLVMSLRWGSIPRLTDWLTLQSQCDFDLRNSSVGGKPPLREDLSPEAENEPLLQAVTRQLLVKTQRSVKDLAWFYKVWKQR
jgi:hypothetical protein